MAKKNYFAVARGRRPGIYRSWEETKQQVDKFVSARFKGFMTHDEAVNFMATERPADGGSSCTGANHQHGHSAVAVGASSSSEVPAGPSTEEDDDVPHSLRCPITMEIFCDPVIDKDGFTYERAAIVEHLERYSTSPMTRRPLALSDLTPNRGMREFAEDFKMKRAQKENLKKQQAAAAAAQAAGAAVPVPGSTTIVARPRNGSSPWGVGPQRASIGLSLLNLSPRAAVAAPPLGAVTPVPGSTTIPPLVARPPNGSSSSGTALTQPADPPRAPWGVGPQRAASIALSLLNLSPRITVSVDGACPGNGKAGSFAGYGGFYGDNDPRNFSRPVPRTEQQTNNRGELWAILHVLLTENDAALEKLHLSLLPGLLLPASRLRSLPSPANQSCSEVPSIIAFRADSMYCIDGCTQWLTNWKRNGWKKSDKKPVQNRDLWERVDFEMELRKRMTSAAILDLIYRQKSSAILFSEAETNVVQSAVAKACITFVHVAGHSGDYGNEKADVLAVSGANMP